jgi:hypothetical protein
MEFPDTFIFVVDTDQYAGNFEREMVAFMTGALGGCGVGEEESAQFHEEYPDSDIGELVCDRPDEHGCWRPAAIWRSPYFWNDGYGNHHRNLVSPKSPEAIAQRDSSLHENQILADLVGTPIVKFTAYCSVACFLTMEPSEVVIRFLMNRAKLYLSKYHPETNILGFRFLEQKVVTDEKHYGA